MAEFDLMAAKRAVFKSGLKPLEKLVALALLDHWSRASSEPFPSVNRLAEWTSLNRATVIRVLTELELKGAVRVARRKGCSNTYTLGQLEHLPVAQRDQSQPATSRTEQPLPVAGCDGDQSQPATLSNPLSNPMKEPTSSAARKGTARSSRRKDPEHPSADSQQLKIHYVTEFKQHRGGGEEPDFGKAWSRAMKAFGELCARRGGLDAAKGIVSRALADPFVRRINPWELVDDANKHVGKPPQPGQRQGVQRGADEAEAQQWGKEGARQLDAE